jgi:threonine dehydrogenase-like Zn-dependent dehydrogenase
MPGPRRPIWPLLLAMILIALPLLAFGQEVPLTAAAPAAAVAAVGLDPTLQYILGAGPLGALVYGAWLLGKGVKISVQVDLSEEDRALLKHSVDLIQRGVVAAEAIAHRPHPQLTPHA